LRTEEMALKRPTWMEKGTKRSQNSGCLKMSLDETRRLSFGVSAEGATGVGGAAGMKKEGTAQTDD
jgi:hypothetical protein